MKFSTKDRYALRLMAELAGRTEGAFISLKEISETQQISVKYLEQIVIPLTRAGLLASGRGAQGGYRLTRSPAQITAGDVLRAMEGELNVIPCLGTGTDCPRRSCCDTLDFWNGLNAAIHQYVDNVTLEDLKPAQQTPATAKISAPAQRGCAR